MGEGRSRLLEYILDACSREATYSDTDTGGRSISGQPSAFHRTQFLSRERTVSTIR